MPAQPFGIFVEVVASGRLLRRAESSSDRSLSMPQMTSLQGLPQGFLVFLRPEWRAHDVRGGAREIRIQINRIVDQQVTWPALRRTRAGPRRAHARSPRPIAARGVVHDVQRHPDHLDQADRAIGCFGLDCRRTRQRMASRRRDSSSRRVPFCSWNTSSSFSACPIDNAQSSARDGSCSRALRRRP